MRYEACLFWLTDYDCCRFSGGIVMVSTQVCPRNGGENGADGSNSRSYDWACAYAIACPYIIWLSWTLLVHMCHNHILFLVQSLRSRKSRHGGQVLILFSWLFQDEFLFQSLMRDLANIVSRKEDHYIALGWCILVRDLLEYHSTMGQYSLNGKKAIHDSLTWWKTGLFFFEVFFDSVPKCCLSYIKIKIT